MTVQVYAGAYMIMAQRERERKRAAEARNAALAAAKSPENPAPQIHKQILGEFQKNPAFWRARIEAAIRMEGRTTSQTRLAERAILIEDYRRRLDGDDEDPEAWALFTVAYEDIHLR